MYRGSSDCFLVIYMNQPLTERLMRGYTPLYLGLGLVGLVILMIHISQNVSSSHASPFVEMNPQQGLQSIKDEASGTTPSHFVVIYFTLPSQTQEKSLKWIDQLVSDGHVACVNRIPGMISTYM